MPELPEVETMRRGILQIEKSQIVTAERSPCRLKAIRITPRIDQLRKRVQGLRIDEVTRIGKRVVLRLESGDSLVFEPRMTGLVLVADPPNRAHLRFRLTLDSKTVPEVYYWDRRGLGSVRLLSAQQFEAEVATLLGPDALQISLAELRARLASSRREIKVALLDQRSIAGIGNLYASEILHVSRVHPGRRCDELTVPEWKRVFRAMRDVLEEAIKYEGSTLGDGTYRNALNNPGGYQNHHRVYGREHQPCPRCQGTEVVRYVQAQRATFYCPGCQLNNSSRSFG